jgi:hypothetical protein
MTAKFYRWPGAAALVVCSRRLTLSQRSHRPWVAWNFITRIMRVLMNNTCFNLRPPHSPAAAG